jgi:hypothetical protein
MRHGALAAAALLSGVAALVYQALNPGNVQGYRGLREAARGLGDRRLLARAG